MKNCKVFFCLVVFSSILLGCAAARTSLEYSDLDISAINDRPVFLRNSASRKIFLNVDCPVIEWKDLEKNLANGFASKGYQIVAESDADILIDVLIRNMNDVRKYSANQVQSRDGTAAGGGLVGAGTGALASGGDPASTIAGAVGGFVVGGIADVTVNSWVHLGVLEVTSAVLVREKLPAEQPKAKATWKETQTGVLVKAKQAGLTWTDAAKPIEAKMQQQILAILPDKKFK